MTSRPSTGLRTRTRLLRALDANINRAHEGLRVCEDLARFYFEREPSYRRLRRLRHDFDRRLRRLPVPLEALVEVRDSRLDPGRKAGLAAVRSAEHLLVMNLQRTKEAFRVVEETARLLAPRTAPALQTLRFRLYDVERSVLLGLAAVRDRRSSHLRRPRSRVGG